MHRFDWMFGCGLFARGLLVRGLVIDRLLERVRVGIRRGERLIHDVAVLVAGQVDHRDRPGQGEDTVRVADDIRRLLAGGLCALAELAQGAPGHRVLGGGEFGRERGSLGHADRAGCVGRRCPGVLRGRGRERREGGASDVRSVVTHAVPGGVFLGGGGLGGGSDLGIGGGLGVRGGLGDGSGLDSGRLDGRVPLHAPTGRPAWRVLARGGLLFDYALVEVGWRVFAHAATAERRLVVPHCHEVLRYKWCLEMY